MVFIQKNNFGIRITKLREYAKEIGKDHDLALKLWESGIHDARMLAAHIDDPKFVTEEQLEKWAYDFDKAIGYLEKAIKADPDFAPAYYKLA